MLYVKCLFSLITIILVISAEIDPENTILEIFDSQTVQKGEKVDVKLFYESRCGYCIQFHTLFFNKTVTKLAAYLDLKTYPYGNAKRKEENGNTTIECQHGPLECYGNKLHACAIDILKNNTLAVFYNSCMMSKGRRSTDEDATGCGEAMGIDGKSVVECAKSEKGEDLLEYYGRETDKRVPDKAGVPWPLINGKVYLGEFEDFMATICATLANPPPECEEL